MKSAAPRDLKLAIVLTSCEPSRDSGSPVQSNLVEPSLYSLYSCSISRNSVPCVFQPPQLPQQEKAG